MQSYGECFAYVMYWLIFGSNLERRLRNCCWGRERSAIRSSSQLEFNVIKATDWKFHWVRQPNALITGNLVTYDSETWGYSTIHYRGRVFSLSVYRSFDRIPIWLRRSHIYSCFIWFQFKTVNSAPIFHEFFYRARQLQFPALASLNLFQITVYFLVEGI